MQVHKTFALLTLAMAAIVVSAQEPATEHKPDNTGVNKQERRAGQPTADQQKENATDRDLARNVRRALVKDKGLSTYAHNVKVISENGVVTLKGPVRSEEERRAVEAKGAEAAGTNNIKNELTVARKGDDREQPKARRARPTRCYRGVRKFRCIGTDAGRAEHAGIRVGEKHQGPGGRHDGGGRGARDSRPGAFNRSRANCRNSGRSGCGRVVGTLVGALIGMGIPEYEAKRYEGRVKDGGILLSVHCDTSEEVDRAKEILKGVGGEDVSSAGEESPSTLGVETAYRNR